MCPKGPRWASAVGRSRLTILVAIALFGLIPDRLTLGPRWVLPTVVGVLLVGVSIADPGRIDRRSTGIRVLSIALLLLLVVAVGWATEAPDRRAHPGRRYHELGGRTASHRRIVWIENGIVFSLLYWELDSEGPASRAVRHPAAIPTSRSRHT